MIVSVVNQRHKVRLLNEKGHVDLREEVAMARGCG